MAAGHRTLLFSQSRVMLDVIAAALAARGVPFLRIDGAVASAADRQVRGPPPPPPPPPPPGAPCLCARGAGAQAAAASGQRHACLRPSTGGLHMFAARWPQKMGLQWLVCEEARVQA